MKTHRANKANNKIGRSGMYYKWAIIVIIFGSFYVWQQIEARRLGYRISEINGRISSLNEENKYLAMKIMDITSMKNLEEIARKHFGMVSPKPSDIVVISYDK